MTYHLKPSPCAKPSLGEYWRLWKAVEQAKPSINRHGLTRRVLRGNPKPNQMTPEQLAKMCKVFSAILRDAAKQAAAAQQTTLPATTSPAETGGAVSSGSGTIQTPPAAAPASGETLPRRITPTAVSIGAERARLLKAFRALPPATLRHASRLLGVSPATLCRLKRDFAHLNDDQITAEALAPRLENVGGRSLWELLAQDPAVRQTLQQIYTATIGSATDQSGKDRRSGSMQLTLHRFADHELCPARLAKQIRHGAKPRPLVKVIREFTPAMEQLARGEKHYGLHGVLTHHRDDTEQMADGSIRQITLGDWWVFDDMSTNFPFWFGAPGGDGSDAWVGRQGLYAYDQQRHWLGLEQIGTSRDSYSAAIILRFIRRLMQALGKPRRGIVLERSVWAAQSIKGYRITESAYFLEEELQREAMAKAEKDRVHDGLKALGIEVHYTYTPRGKEIEGAFNYFQRVFPTIAADEGVNIGRHAGEFEHGAKQLRRAHAGSHHPADLGFLHIDAHADLSEKTMAWINAKANWENESAAESNIQYPALGELTPRDLAVFMPNIHKELKIHQAQVVARVNGENYHFTHPEIFGRLGTGYRVQGKFDPSEPTLGMAIYNREPAQASINPRGYHIGEFLGWAEFLPAVPRFVWAQNSDAAKAGELKKRVNKFVRTAFRAVGNPQHRTSTARDGAGNVAVVTAAESVPASTFVPKEPQLRAAVFDNSPGMNVALMQRQADRARQLLAK